MKEVSPKITVLLPVYDAEKYLAEAIESILNQTYTDFELLIIDDASTDSSFSIATSYKDTRIRVVQNKKNLGITDTLNKGVELAKGEYIARMDADDISLPNRLKKQIEFIESNDCTLVATKITVVNEQGVELSKWRRDRGTVTPFEIKRMLPSMSCIAHPTVMIKASVLKEYKYSTKQNGAEDYDLWLRLVDGGHVLSKIDEELLLYRVHPESSTQKESLNNYFKKSFLIKYRFLIGQYRILKFSFFNTRVLGSALWDVVLMIFPSLRTIQY